VLPVPISGARWPTKGAGAYLYRRSDIHLHQGVDLPARKGTPVWSVFSGVVETSSPPGARGFDGYGRVVVVRRADGVRAMFAHLDSSLVHEGENVTEGQQIATVGTSRGTVEQPDLQFQSSGAHLHFEASRKPYPMAREGGRIDPLGVEPMPDNEDQRDSIERWKKLDGLISQLYNAVPAQRRAEVQPLLDEWRAAYEAAPRMGRGLRAAAMSDWVTRYNDARKMLAEAGASVPPAVRDIGVHQDVADAADAVKDAASGAFSWVVVAALAWLWIESQKREQVIQIEMVKP
jgi:hypothetical protein